MYPAAAAPFVRLLGTSRGLLFTNAVLLGLALWLGYRELRGRAGPLAALATAAVLFLGTVTPVYFLWFTPEIFNLALVTGGLVAWRRGRPALSAVLLGLADLLEAHEPPAGAAPGPGAARGEWPRRAARVRPPGSDPGRGRARRLRPHLGGHRRGELSGWRAEDVLRLLPLRVSGRDLRQRRHLDDDRAPRPPGGGEGRRQAVGPRGSAPPALRDPRRRSRTTSATSGSGGSAERCPTSARPSLPPSSSSSSVPGSAPAGSRSRP